MIEAIKEIGRYVVGDSLDRDAFLDGICKKTPAKVKDNDGNEVRQYVVIFNFNTNTGKIEIDFEEINANGEDSGNKYTWIGNSKGNNPQISLTTDTPIYLFTKTLPNIRKKATGTGFEKTINHILESFFVEDNGDYIIDTSKFSFLEEKVRDIEKMLDIVKDNITKLSKKKEANEVEKELKNICRELDIKCDLSLKGDLDKVKERLSSKCNELGNLNILKNLAERYKKDILKRAKSQGKRESAILNDYLYMNSLTKQNVALYTIKFNSKILANEIEYKNILYNEKIDSLFDVKENKSKKEVIMNGDDGKTPVCSICGTDTLPTTSNTTNLDFKFYMTDKPGFSSNFDEEFTKNYNICKSCYQYLMIGENFIDENLNTKIGGLNTYIIPNFIFKIDKLDIKRFSKYIEDSSSSISNQNYIEAFQNKLQRFIKYEAKKNNYILNYLFYQKSKSNFRILKLIMDVPPSRLDFIREKEEEISNIVDSRYGSGKSLKIDLNQIWGCFPIKRERGDSERGGSYLGFSRYLEVLDAIFSDKIIDYPFLLNQFTEVIRIIKFDRKGYNIWTGQDFTNKILQMNFLFLFFKKLDILGGINMNEIGNKNEEDLEALPKEIIDYWQNIEIYSDDSKKALFLLGYLIGEIGNKQSNKKPILNKVNFQGMDIDRVKRLSNEVLEKLVQYNIMVYNENIHEVLKRLMDRKIADWNLSNQENVFYTLSGYAFSNYLLRKRSKDKYLEEYKQISEQIEKAKKDGKDMKEIEETLKDAKNLADEGKYSDAREKLKEIKENIKEVE